MLIVNNFRVMHHKNMKLFPKEFHVIAQTTAINLQNRDFLKLWLKKIFQMICKNLLQYLKCIVTSHRECIQIFS